MSSSHVSDEGEDKIEQDRTNEQTFRLFDLPAELWIRCCQLAVLQRGPILIEKTRATNDLEDTAPPNTRTCTAIRKETLNLFYAENDFRSIDRDHTIALTGLCNWLTQGWKTYWPLVKVCTVESTCVTVQDHLRDLFSPKLVSFSDGPPDEGTVAIFQMIVEDDQDPSDKEDDEAEDYDDANVEDAA